MSNLSLKAASEKEALEKDGIDFSADFHALTTSHVLALVESAKRLRYKAPRNANGSTARYYFRFLGTLA